MPVPSLDDILTTLGRLDDYPGEDTPREGFRRHLREHVTEPHLVLSYIAQCLGKADQQHTRALRDLIIHLGRFFGFEVSYGPYEWLPGAIGFDGRWTSAWGPHIVLEVKSRETYISRRPTLARRIEQLIADGEIPGWNLALGLYVIARPGLDVGHLEKQILDERQAHQLRIIKPESLCALADLTHRGRLTQQDVLTVLRGGGPTADWLVDLIVRVATAPEPERETPEEVEGEEPAEEAEQAAAGAAEEAAASTGTEARAAGDELDQLIDAVGLTVERLGDCLVRVFEDLFGPPRGAGPRR
jgi:hypothetical protein